MGAADLAVDGHQVTLPVGTGFDPGGIGKGLAADLVVDELRAHGALGACVNLGGDVRVAGLGPDPADRGWTVEVRLPEPRRAGAGDPALVRIGLADGAVATSTTRLRRWTGPDGMARHHLIDPRSGRPSDTDLDLATVVAADAWVAEVLAKAVILRGAEHPFDVVEATAAQALAVDHRGRVQATAGLSAYLGDQILPTRLALPPSSPFLEAS